MDSTRVGRYEVLRELGRGGMATVHLARQLDLDRLVALKRLDGLADQSDARVRRFVREARLAGSLSHPNIVTVHDAFEVDGVPYIAMELVPGGTLRPLLSGLSLEQIAGVLDGVLAGLDHAERHHIVHRDLKPENLMVTAEGGIKITDFGIAKATTVAGGDDAPLTTAGVAIGTPAYMAPEQALAEDAGPQTDLYALGVVAFEMLTGRVPFEDPEAPVRVLMRHVSEPPPRVADLRPRVDPELSDWVAALLAKEPLDRPPGAAAARERLEDIVLRLRGPRWRREAPLPFRPGAAATAALQSRDARPPTARLSSEPTRAARRTPPAPAVHDDPPAAVSRRGARVPRAATLALVASVAAAAIAAGASGIGGGAPRRADPAVEVSQAQPAATAATVAASPAAVAPSPSASPSGSAAAPAPIDSARAVDAERESRRFAAEAQDTEGDGDEALTQQLRDTEYAYRDAAAAAEAGDTGRFNTLFAKADALARTALARLDGDGSDSGDDGDDEDEADEDDNGD